MRLNILLLFALTLSLVLQLIFFSFPLVFLLTYIILARSASPFLIVMTVFLSIAADAVLIQPTGITLLFAAATNLGVFLYARFLGSKDNLVYILFGLIGTFIYAIILGYSVTSLFNWYIVFLLIWVIYRLIPKKYLSL